MVSRKGFWFILFRVVLLTLFSMALAYSYFQTSLVITPFMFGLMLLIVAIELIWYLQRQERNWIRFLQSVKYRDFNRAYQNQTDSKELADAYDMITLSMEELQSSRQAEFRLLQTVLGHISVAVVCVQEDGEVIFTNKAFDSLLNLPGLIHIDRLKEDYGKIYDVLTAIDDTSIEWIDHADGQKLLVKTETFKLMRINYRLISFTDIRSPLDAKELDSYQKLMRVMTHEIMNSATPILSLIRVVNQKLVRGPNLAELNAKDQRNIGTSLRAVEERTAGILGFVEAYKQINKTIEPHRSNVDSKELAELIITLMNQPDDITLEVKDELEDTIFVDKSLISQVLINLVKNAIDAVQPIDGGKILVLIRKKADQVIIDVEDNGPGVSVENLHQIFVPFYTTKPEGSGIGLALSRKIVKAHGGLLEYSRGDQKTRFSIALPL